MLMPLTRLQQNWGQLGVLNGTLYSLARLLERSSRGRIRLVRYLIVAQPVPPPLADRPPPRGKLLVRQVGADDPKVALFPRPSEVIEQRFQDGAVCLVASIDDKFAGFLWLAFDHYDEDEVRCRYLLPDARASAWDYDVYVAPEYRLGRTFSRLWGAANRFLADRGVHWSISRISAFNTNSIAVHRRMGMVTLFPVNFLVVGETQLTFMRRFPFFHLSLTPDRPPKLPIAAPETARGEAH